ncbi:uncharacterized protein LOC107368100 isoform X2 [Tetranychus urticae]|uniref:uncharacterized protein LOC107368100 isoform X2 n=1 Tax=Tetranychus urticae TaxID=32264 RepID=UPI00077BAA7A|nr:uncharacterized protein LOC107368100 isoform X2 [Tetranychus urticae]
MYSLQKFSFLTFACLLIIVPMLSDYYGIVCIKLVNLFVPDRATRGSDVELKCIYDLEKDSLYVLKWHFNGREFYRYAPKSEAKTQTFNVTGTKVNKDKSNQGIVVLSNVSLNSTGRYKCEISVEGTFQTVIKEKYMKPISENLFGTHLYHLTGCMLLHSC